ncbi:MAG: ABC transporter permease [Chitinophagales bacterium]|nr:ABC transporter permease [Chitinophagales bacterium]
MILNHLKISFRSLWKNKRYSVLNILGLSLAMTTCLLLMQYVGYELSFDRFHSKADSIYRVINDRFQNGERVQKGTITYPTIGPVMTEEYPEVEAYTRLFFQGNMMIHRDEDYYRTSEGLYADQHFFEFFDFELLAGKRTGILSKAYEVVITEKLARHFFEIENDDFEAIIGETIELDRDRQAYEIIGVCADFPSNSLLQAEILASYKTFIQEAGEAADISWSFSDFYHFLQIKPGTDIATLEHKFEAFSDRHFQGEQVSNAEERFYLQPLKEAHLYSSDLEYEIGQTANGKVIWAMLGVAFFILLLAWVNYINLATVRAIERAKEVGIRRIVGAGRRQLINQFITEAAVVNGVSLGVALVMATGTQPWFAQLIGQPISFSQSVVEGGLLYILVASLLIWLVMGIISTGVYPALLLLNQQATEVLKGTYRQSGRSHAVRRGLVIFQFAASIALVSLTWIAFQQLRYMSQQDLGVSIDQILRVSGPELTAFDTVFIDKIHAFKQELMVHPAIEQVSMSGRVPGDNTGRIFGLQAPEKPDQNLTFRFIETDHSFDETYQMQALAGRGLRRGDHNLDFNQIKNVVINEQSIQALGYSEPEEAIGEEISFWNKSWVIVGVMPDFHQQSFHHPIEPTLYLPVYNTYQAFSLRINTADTDGAIAHLKDSYQSFFPGNMLEYEFLNNRFQAYYEADQRFGNILLFFTILAILIACLGVFGLASYMVYLRTKEIGIRKILGASVQHILTLLSKDFLQLALWGALIAVPIAWFASRYWLSDFVYRITPQWWVFIVGGLLASMLALLTVSLNTIQAARANPVDSLRNE